jgi:sulfur-oxidizing protein SoxX
MSRPGRSLATGSLLLLSAVAAAQTLARYTVVADTIPAPLTVHSGSPERGRELFTGRDDGHCVLCHRIDGLDAPFQGNVGPDLSAVGSRLTPQQIRLRIVDASILNPMTIMPPYYRTVGLNQVAVQYRDRPALSAAQVEDLVAYLAALKDRVP